MLNISGIAIKVCKKSIKNMHLYVKPPDGHVTVSAPLSMSDEAIERFVRTRITWVKSQIANSTINHDSLSGSMFLVKPYMFGGSNTIFKSNMVTKTQLIYREIRRL